MLIRAARSATRNIPRPMQARGVHIENTVYNVSSARSSSLKTYGFTDDGFRGFQNMPFQYRNKKAFAVKLGMFCRSERSRSCLATSLYFPVAFTITGFSIPFVAAAYQMWVIILRGVV